MCTYFVFYKMKFWGCQGVVTAVECNRVPWYCGFKCVLCIPLW